MTPRSSDIDATAPKHLRGRYAIVGVGETAYTRGSGTTTRVLGTTAVRRAAADAGLALADIDGMLSYNGNDSVPSTAIAGDLGMRLNFYMDCHGGGSSTEALVGIAIGVIEAGLCKTVAIYRAMNGYSQLRIGGTGRSRGRSALSGDALFGRAFGQASAAQSFAPSFMRHMYEYGTTPEQVAYVKAIHSEHASNNPKAYYRQRVTVADVLASRMICKPLHLLDCCVETDNGNCIIVTSLDRAKDCRHTPAVVLGVVGRCSKPRMDSYYQSGPISTVAGAYAKDILWPNAGVGPEDIQATGAYDAFTFTTLLQLEDYGFCKKGEGGDYVSSGIMRLGGARPNNTSGGHLCEGYGDHGALLSRGVAFEAAPAFVVQDNYGILGGVYPPGACSEWLDDAGGGGGNYLTVLDAVHAVLGCLSDGPVLRYSRGARRIGGWKGVVPDGWSMTYGAFLYE